MFALVCAHGNLRLARVSVRLKNSAFGDTIISYPFHIRVQPLGLSALPVGHLICLHAMDSQIPVESRFGSAAAREIGGGRHRHRLLVMSNRAPIRLVRERGVERIVPTVGGVGTTFFRLLELYGGLWIAWSGVKDSPG